MSNNIEDESNEYEESIATTDINLTLDTLLPVDKYKKLYLEKVAKSYGIPTTYRDGSKRINYVKNELYEKIKEKLERK